MNITRIFTFDAAHMLDTHDGKCRNLHGHTYRLEVTLSGSLIQGGAKDGMVCDFSDVKHDIEQHIISRFDHALLYDSNNANECELAALLEQWGKKTLRLPCRTTAENMAAYIYHTLEDAKLPVSHIRLWETPNAYCDYSGSAS